MPWGAKIGSKTVRFDDLSPQAWIRVDAESASSWAEVYTAPLKDPAACLIVLEECVRLVEPSADAVTRVQELTPRMRDLAELLVEVDDDLPDTAVDGVPPRGDDGSTVG